MSCPRVEERIILFCSQGDASRDFLKFSDSPQEPSEYGWSEDQRRPESVTPLSGFSFTSQPERKKRISGEDRDCVGTPLGAARGQKTSRREKGNVQGRFYFTILRFPFSFDRSFPFLQRRGVGGWFLFTFLVSFSVVVLTGCTPTQTAIYKEKPQTVVTDSGPFNAADYERAAFDFRNEGRLELAGAATERANALRRAGDTSTRPTPWRITAKDLEDAARKFESEGKLDLAQEARDAARYLREKERIGSLPPQPVRNKALIL